MTAPTPPSAPRPQRPRERQPAPVAGLRLSNDVPTSDTRLQAESTVQMNTCSCRNPKQMTLADARLAGRRVGDHVVPAVVRDELGALCFKEGTHDVRICRDQPVTNLSNGAAAVDTGRRRLAP